MGENQNVSEVVESTDKPKKNVFERFSNLKLRYKVLLFFCSAIIFLVYFVIAGIVYVGSMVVNVVAFFTILFPLAASVGLYVPAVKKQSRQLFKAFLAIFLFTGISTLILSIFVEYLLVTVWIFGIVGEGDGWSAHVICHIIFFIISILLLIIIIVFFTTETKRLLKKL